MEMLLSPRFRVFCVALAVSTACALASSCSQSAGAQHDEVVEWSVDARFVNPPVADTTTWHEEPVDVQEDPLPTSTCLTASPTEIDFGAMSIGEKLAVPLVLTACEEADVVLTSMAGRGAPFHLLREDAPWLPLEGTVISAGGQATLSVYFAPEATAGPEAESPILPYQGELIVRYEEQQEPGVPSGFGELQPIPVKGKAFLQDCAVAVPWFKPSVGDPLQIELHGSGSASPNGPLEKFAWKAEGPPGATAVFQPSASVADPLLVVDQMGAYEMTLTVWDDQGTSCGPATLKYVVAPPGGLAEIPTPPATGIYVALGWRTPGDPDETDTGPEAGSDMDVHFTHPWAAGPDLDGDGIPDGWFHMPFDCFWSREGLSF